MEPSDEEFESGILDGTLTLFGRNLGRAERSESCVVGSAIWFREQAILAVENLNPEYFIFTPARIVFLAIRELINEGREVDDVNVMDAIMRAKHVHNFPENNPALYIIEIKEYAGRAVGFEYHVGLIRDLYSRRLTMQIAARLNDSLDSREPVSAIVQRFGQEILSVQDRDAKSKVVTLAESSRRLASRIDEFHRTGGVRQVGLGTGFSEIDDCTGGLRDGYLIILAARPSVGKSAFAGLIAKNVAEDGKNVLFFSLEMSEVELTERMLAATSRVPMPAIRGHRKLNHVEADQIFNVLTGQFPKLNFSFIDRRGITTRDLASDARTYARQSGGISLVVVDYLQLLKPENPRDPRHLQVGMAAKALRNLAGELKCPVLCLAQLNREPESRGGEPKLSDLRDSGEIEQDADVVLLLHRKSSDPTLPIQEIDVLIAKNRNGPTGKVELTYQRALTKFTQKPIPM
ncbi:MAG: DnaB-like helicase C-terminal domain-containing protein [Gemmataceae bacterium]